MKLEEAVAGMFSGIGVFLADTVPTCLQSINVIVFEKSMLATFEQAQKALKDKGGALLPSEAKLPNLCAIKIEEGNVAKSNADVVVATRGVVFNAVLKADPTVSSDWKKNFPQGWDTDGKVFSLNTSKLPAKQVLAIAPPRRDKTKNTSSECRKKLADVVAKCIETADTSNFTSIAFPAIGTGKLGFTNSHSASAILEGARIFSNTVKNPSLKSINIIVFENHRILDFQKELQKFSSSLNVTSAISLSSPARSSQGSTCSSYPRMHQTTSASSVSFMVCGRDEGAVRQAVVKLRKAANYNCISVEAKVLASFDREKIEEIARESDVALTVSPCGPGLNSSPVINVAGERSNVQKARLLITEQLLKMSGSKFIAVSSRNMSNFTLVLTIGSAVEYPPSWTSDPESEKAVMIGLQQNDGDYEYVSNKFWSTLKDKDLKNVKIKEILRVENRTNYRRFAQAKEELRKTRAKEIDAKKAVLQMDLFHGTHKDSVQHIIDCGFNRSFSGSVVGTSKWIDYLIDALLE